DGSECGGTAPVAGNGATSAVDETAVVGTLVGGPAHASDAVSIPDAVPISLTDNAGGRFAIDATTGVVTVAGAIDREAAASYDIKVRRARAGGPGAEHSCTVNVAGVNEVAVTTPVDGNAAANAAGEHAGVGT